jgi:hypothetical protein
MLVNGLFSMAVVLGVVLSLSPGTLPAAAGAGMGGTEGLLITAGPDIITEVNIAHTRSTDWWGAAQRGVLLSEYEVSSEGQTGSLDLPATYEAPNRAHNLRAFFTEAGLRLVRRTATPDWELRLALAGFRSGEAGMDHSAPSLHAEGNQVRYGHDSMTEVYVNSPYGLEHRIEIAAAPDASATEPLQVKLALAGSVLPSLDQEGHSVVFQTPAGERVVLYEKARALDGVGRALATETTLVEDDMALCITLQDTPVVYPVTILATVTGVSTTPNWQVEGDEANGQLGMSVGTAGDLNGDGYGDVVVSAHGYDGGQVNQGRALVYYGGPAGLPTTPSWYAQGGQANTSLGGSVSTAGDVNGDGYADLLVGAAGYDITSPTPLTDAGAVMVWFGSPTGLGDTGTPDNADWIALGDRVEGYLGRTVNTAGDINGDGFSDIMAGSPYFDDPETDEGGVFVYLGSPAGPNPTPDWQAHSNQAETQMAYDIDTAGDVNGDGFSDIIVSAHRYSKGEFREGAAFVWYGSATGLGPDGTPANADWIAESNTDGYTLGLGVGTAGDVNGDGYADVIVGCRQYHGGINQQGAIFVWFGSDSGLGANGNLTNYDWMAIANRTESHLGWGATTAGDVNGDGFADIIAGAPFYDNGHTDEGAAFLWLGSETGLGPIGTPANADWSAEGNQENAWFGYDTATAGDINGDGFADIIAGAPYYDVTIPSTLDDAGAAYLYHGGGGNGVPLLPRQMRSDGSAPIAPLGLSDSPGALQLRLTGHMPMGREDAKLQWQVAPLGRPFTDPSVVSGVSATWTDLLTTGVELTQQVSGLTSLSLYHWRVRLLYRPGNRLGLSASRWVHVPWNGWEELDFRTPGGGSRAYLPLIMR